LKYERRAVKSWLDRGIGYYTLVVKLLADSPCTVEAPLLEKRTFIACLPRVAAMRGGEAFFSVFNSAALARSHERHRTDGPSRAPDTACGLHEAAAVPRLP
jgi:hypothetical protein